MANDKTNVRYCLLYEYDNINIVVVLCLVYGEDTIDGSIRRRCF